MTALNDESALRAAEEAAREAGAFQMAEFRSRPAGWGDAKDAHDFVSHVDVQSERLIRCRLEAILPDAAFYGEETEQRVGPGATWVVDPLDGTTNFLSGFDHFAVSIGLRGPDGAMELGVVLKPATGELFSARRGCGAARNGVPLPRASALDPKAALVATGTPYRSRDTDAAFFGAVTDVMNACRDVRRTGSAALDLAYLAAGYFQAFWEADLQPYDVAAGLLLLSETGHQVFNFQGRPYRLFEDRGFVAGRPGVVEPVLAAVEKNYGGLR